VATQNAVEASLAEIDAEGPPVETSNKVKAPVAAKKVGEASHSK
jgi:hypothetical protein